MNKSNRRTQTQEAFRKIKLERLGVAKFRASEKKVTNKNIQQRKKLAVAESKRKKRVTNKQIQARKRRQIKKSRSGWLK